MVRIGHRQAKFHLGIRVYPDQWNQRRQHAYISPLLSAIDNTNNQTVNEKINAVKMQFAEYKEYICNLESDIDILSGLKSAIGNMAKKRKTTQIEDIIKVIRSYVINDSTIGEATSKNYLNKGIPALQFYIDYLAKDKHQIVNNFHAFTTEFFNSFASHIFNNYAPSNGKTYSVSTVNSILKYAKSAIVLAARAGGYLTEQEINAIKLRQFDDKSSDNHIALRNDEVMKLYRHKCSTSRDEIIRDIFLLECTLGHRISDIQRIDDRVEEIDGKHYVTLAPKKTPNKKIEVGIIFDIAKRILIDKYHCKLPACDKDAINHNIKRIAKEAGINGLELHSYHSAGDSQPTESKKQRYDCISTHTGRRTFVSLLSARGWKYEAISKYTGQSLDMVDHYDKASAKYVDIYKETLKNHPEDIVRLSTDPKMISDVSTTTSIAPNSDYQFNCIIELARESERQKNTIEQLTQSITESENRVQQVKYSADIERQIESLQGKSEKEKAELLEMLMKMGFSYDDYLSYQKEREDRESEIEIADSHHDTLLDD